MNKLHKIINIIKHWKPTLTQLNLVLVNVFLLILITKSKDLDEFIKIFGQISLSLCAIFNAMSGLELEDMPGDTDV